MLVKTGSIGFISPKLVETEVATRSHGHVYTPSPSPPYSASRHCDLCLRFGETALQQSQIMSQVESQVVTVADSHRTLPVCGIMPEVISCLSRLLPIRTCRPP